MDNFWEENSRLSEARGDAEPNLKTQPFREPTKGKKLNLVAGLEHDVDHIFLEL